MAMKGWGGVGVMVKPRRAGDETAAFSQKVEWVWCGKCMYIVII
jgi:hypothetical protein